MRTINITSYKPYDHIVLSHDVILSSLKDDRAVFNTGPVVFKSQNAVQCLPVRKTKPVHVFGELERILMMMI